MKLLLVSHGNLAYEFAQSAKMIIGELNNIKVVGLQPQANLTEFEREIIDYLEDAKVLNEEVFIMTDLFFGTPFNVVVTLSRKYEFNHITGLNLPILLEVLNCMNNYDAKTLREYVMKMANDSIVDVNCFLENNK